ncbi:16S rRNA (uracil(1498)-N(3))-methyltransferase [Dermabacteraceae bacterium P13138]
MTRKNFLYEAGPLAGLAAGATVLLDGEEGRHAARVSRIRSGEEILLTDRHGNQAVAAVTEAGRDHLACSLLSAPASHRYSGPRLILVQALAKGGRDEQAVETATELGVDAITPWQAQRCVSVWKGSKAARGREKWQATVDAAVKQSRRGSIPEVTDAVDSNLLAKQIAARSENGGVTLLLHEEADIPLTRHLVSGAGGDKLAQASEIAFIVGPEGGVSPQETEMFCAAGALKTLLGREVLRASTAGPVALAVLAAHLGRWEETNTEGDSA